MRPLAVFGVVAVIVISCSASRAQWTGTYKATLPAASSPGRTLVLDITPDQKVRLSTDYRNSQPPVIEIGTWSATEDRLLVVLTGRSDRTYDKPVMIQFELAGNTLTAVAYDLSLYGSAGLKLSWQ